MKQTILVAIVYIIIFILEIIAYGISKSGCIFVYGLITLITFIITFNITLEKWK